MIKHIRHDKTYDKRIKNKKYSYLKYLKSDFLRHVKKTRATNKKQCLLNISIPLFNNILKLKHLKKMVKDVCLKDFMTLTNSWQVNYRLFWKYKKIQISKNENFYKKKNFIKTPSI